MITWYTEWEKVTHSYIIVKLIKFEEINFQAVLFIIH